MKINYFPTNYYYERQIQNNKCSGKQVKNYNG